MKKVFSLQQLPAANAPDYRLPIFPMSLQSATLSPIEITERNGKTILTAEVDGSFDKTGLPDPFLMDLYFTHDENLISALKYRLAGK